MYYDLEFLMAECVSQEITQNNYVIPETQYGMCNQSCV